MGDPKGFLEHGRELPGRRPVPVRLKDWNEVYEDFDRDALAQQAGRCMDCGIPFCNNGCPLGNLIPDWNDFVYREQWRDAIERRDVMTAGRLMEEHLMNLERRVTLESEDSTKSLADMLGLSELPPGSPTRPSSTRRRETNARPTRGRRTPAMK